MLVYVLRPGFIEVDGQGINLVPGQYLEVNNKDASTMYENGQAFLCDEGPNDRETKVNNRSRATSRRTGRGKNLSTSGRKYRR